MSSSSSLPWLFLNESPTEFACLTALRTAYAVDCSGSTAGAIMRQQMASCEQLSTFLAPDVIIAWNGRAEVKRSFNCIASGGATLPSTIVPLLSNETQCIVLYTDGCVDRGQMRVFQQRLSERFDNSVPIIVIFTMFPGRYTLASSVVDLECQVDMSIPEACLALTSHACVVVNVGGEHKVLMSSGVFHALFQSVGTTFEPETRLSTLPDFDMARLTQGTVGLSALPLGRLRLNGFDQPLSLEALYTHFDDVPIDVIEAIADRVHFAKLDVDRLRAASIERAHALSHSVDLRRISEQLATLAANPETAGGSEHRALLDELSRARKHRRQRRGTDASRMRAALQRLLSMLAAYTADCTSIALGSNRANRAKIFGDDILDEIGDCITVDECPVMLNADQPACLLLQAPSQFRLQVDDEFSSNSSDDGYNVGKQASLSTNTAALLEFCTNDMAMEAPFYFGSMLSDCVTPGIFSWEFARIATTNPFTRAPVIGYLPLSTNPTVVMRHMAKIFGASREMWHFVRAYFGMVTAHVCNDGWAHRIEIGAQVQELMDNYDCTYNLKGGTDDRRPLRACLEYVLTNFGACLRDRLPHDSRTIMLIASTWLPQVDFSRTRIEGMLNVVEQFAFLLAEHKRHVDMRQFLMEVDDHFGHYIRHKTSVRALIARLLWNDALRTSSHYRGLKLQTAVETALQDKVYGAALRQAFAGDSFTLSSIAAPEPRGFHFGEERFGQWTAEGRSSTVCVYCGDTFDDKLALLAHLQHAMGAYYYSGQKAVREAMDEAKILAASNSNAMDDAVLFKAAKETLFRECGQDCAVLHTQHCKNRLLHFIRKFKQQR